MKGCTITMGWVPCGLCLREKHAEGEGMIGSTMGPPLPPSCCLTGHLKSIMQNNYKENVYLPKAS
jgi:hypothetical protein